MDGLVWNERVGPGVAPLLSRHFAAGVSWAVYRAFRPSFGSRAAALAIIAVVLAPPYNVMAVSYNTSAELAYVLAIALGWQAVRDGSRRSSAGAGAAAALGALSYPTLAPVAVVMGLTLLAGELGDAGVFVPFPLACAALTALCLGPLVVIASPHGVAVALNYSSGTWGGNVPPDRPRFELRTPATCVPPLQVAGSCRLGSLS